MNRTYRTACSVCGQEHSSSYAWYGTPKDTGMYVCRGCAGYTMYRERTSNKPHGAMVASVSGLSYKLNQAHKIPKEARDK